MDRFTYSGSCISLGSPISDEISSSMQQSRLVFANVRPLWLWRHMRLSIKCRVYTAALRSALIYGFEKSTVRVADIRKLFVFYLCFIRNTDGIYKKIFVNNSKLKCEVLRSRVHSVKKPSNRILLIWLEIISNRKKSFSFDRFPQTPKLVLQFVVFSRSKPYFFCLSF